jgi:hypothetical protein
MNDAATTNAELIEYIDAWLDDNSWRLDRRTLDFALDVRLMAGGITFEPIPDAPEWVASMADV